jgi:GT2 family glycosyltransferase
VNYSETRRETPDYIATHAMVIDSMLFRKSGGFNEDFLPIIEDVEFSHRLKRSGFRLVMNPDILVRHIFNFTLMKSLKNAFRKSMFWTIYSLKNRDLFSDSGTASIGLKINTVSLFSSGLSILLYFLSGKAVFLFIIPFILILNLLINRGLLKAFYQNKGLFFAIISTMYYTMIYTIPVGIGAIVGTMRYFFPLRDNP